MVRRLRYRLIRLLAGDDAVIVNMGFNGVTVHGETGQNGLMANCTFRNTDVGTWMHGDETTDLLRLAD